MGSGPVPQLTLNKKRARAGSVMPGRAGGFWSGMLESTAKIGNMRIDCWNRLEIVTP